MFGCMMNVQSLREAPGLMRFKSFIKRGDVVSVQIIHNQPNFDGIRVTLVKHLLDLLRQVFPGSVLSHRDMAPTGQGLHFHENFDHPISDVLIVHPQRLSRLAGDRLMDFADQLLAGLVHANYRIIGIILQVINLQNIFHRRYKGCAPFRRNFPVFAEVRLKFIFFNTLCTVMCETEDAKLSSTALSASSLTVQRWCPSGAS